MIDCHELSGICFIRMATHVNVFLKASMVVCRQTR